MNRPNPFRSAFSAGAVTPQDVLEFHRRTFGCATMEAEPAAPERPEGVAEDEWAALGDPGKRAIVRERERTKQLETELAAARAPKPAPPKPADPPKPEGEGGGKQGDATDIEAMIRRAVDAAVAPFTQREQERTAQEVAQRITTDLTTAAESRLLDKSDALAHIDLTTLTDGNGAPDAAKITAALDDLVQRKPHLAKVVDDRRRPGAGSLLGGGAAPAVSDDDKVKAALAKMQGATNVKFAGA